MKNYLMILILGGLIIQFSCQQNNNTTISTDLTGFTQKEVAGGAGIKVEKRDDKGNIVEEGVLINGVKNGAWITYHPNREKVVKTLANYVNNELNGVYLTFSNRGQIETLTTYSNGVYDGDFAKFRFGNLEESATYVNGELHGIYRKYHQNNRIQTEATYKNGKQDGMYKFFDDEGNMLMEYQYKDGEKITGGLTNQ